MSNVVKFADTVEDMSYSLHYSESGSNRSYGGGTLVNAEKILNAAKYEALKIITEAREQALMIKTTARKEAMQEHEQLRKEGYELGISEGRQEAEKEAAQMLQEIGDFVTVLHEERNKFLKQNHSAVKELSIAVARKVINTELDENDSAFINLFRMATEECTAGEWVKLSVSASEYELATSHKELLMSMVKGAKYMDIVKLNKHPKGTCIVETSSGIMDASIETQLGRISDAFNKADEASRFYDENEETA